VLSDTDKLRIVVEFLKARGDHMSTFQRTNILGFVEEEYRPREALGCLRRAYVN